MLGAENVEPAFRQFGGSVCRLKSEGGLLLTLKVQ